MTELPPEKNLEAPEHPEAMQLPEAIKQPDAENQPQADASPEADVSPQAAETPGPFTEEPPASADTAEGGRPKAPELKTPSAPKRALYSLTSPETRTGRFVRGLLRTLALIVGLFGLGLLVGYVLLYRPAARQLDNAHRQATLTAADLQQARQDLASARQNQQTAQTQAGDTQARLDVEIARSQILRSMNAITQARMAIQGNNKAGAVKSLDTARGYLQAIQPLLAKRDAQQAATLDALFTLTKNDIDRDLKLAAQDLDRLQSELERAEANVLK